MEPITPNELKFEEGERVLCFYADLLYEGKILKAKANQEQNMYLIHYLGWTRSWDEWVPENRVLKHTFAGIAQQKKLEQEHLDNSKPKIIESTSTPAKKRGRPPKIARASNEQEQKVGTFIEIAREIDQTIEQKNNPKSREKKKSRATFTAQSPFFPIAKVKYGELLIGIFSNSLDSHPRLFFFEPLVILDPKSIVSKSHGSFKQDFIQITIRMWNEELRSKVLQRLKTLDSLQNVNFGEEDICVMPFKEVQLVCKSATIKLTDQPASYLRSNENIDFYLLLCDSSSANVLAHDFRQNPEFTLSQWQLKLECRGLSTEFRTNTSAESNFMKGSTFSFNISVHPNDIEKFPVALSAGGSSAAKSMVTFPASDTVEADHPVSSSNTSIECPKPFVKQFDAVISSSLLVPDEIAQSNLADVLQQPLPSSETIKEEGSTDSKLNDISQCFVSTVKIKKSPEGARLSWKPPHSTAGEITGYSVSLAVKGSSSTQSVESLSYTRVYCGTSTQCTVPDLFLVTAHIDTTIKPAIIFRIAACNEKGYGPATQVMWIQDSCTLSNKQLIPNAQFGSETTGTANILSTGSVATSMPPPVSITAVGRKRAYVTGGSSKSSTTASKRLKSSVSQLKSNKPLVVGLKGPVVKMEPMEALSSSENAASIKLEPVETGEMLNTAAPSSLLRSRLLSDRRIRK